MIYSFSLMCAYIMKQQNVFKNSPGWTSLSGSPLKLMGIGADMRGGIFRGGVTGLDWTDCCGGPG